MILANAYISCVDGLPPPSIIGDKSVSPHRPVASLFFWSEGFLQRLGREQKLIRSQFFLFFS